jgi:hypothetical protein
MTSYRYEQIFQIVQDDFMHNVNDKLFKHQKSVREAIFEYVGVDALDHVRDNLRTQVFVCWKTIHNALDKELNKI